MNFVPTFFRVEDYDKMQHMMDDPRAEKFDYYEHAWKYLKIQKRYDRREIGPTLYDEKNKVKELLVETFGGEEGAALWEELISRDLLSSPATTRFMLDYGVYSKVFTPWLLRMPHASNLNVSFGIDIYEQKIPESDAFYWWTVHEPIFIWHRFRTLYACQYLQGKENVAIFGLGMAPELRAMEDMGMELPAKIVACDMDDDVSRWAREYAETPKMKGRLDFRQENLADVLKKLPNGSQDVIWMGGVASYAVEKLPILLTMARMKLKKGGRIILDLQVVDDSLLRNMKVLNWTIPGFTPLNCVDEAVQIMNRATKDLSFSEAVYCVDRRIKRDIGVCFCMKKGPFTTGVAKAYAKMVLSVLRAKIFQ